MSGSTYGRLFRITTWGESHGKGLGVVIDGCPAGISLCEEDIQTELNRRRPGSNKFSTPRQEMDAVEIMSGVFEGATTGTPISLIIFNNDARSHDYGDIESYYRPGHADYTYDMKYGFRDYRGGGRSSGRETAARVAAGAVAKKILSDLNISVDAYTISIAGMEIDRTRFDIAESRNNPLCIPDKDLYPQIAQHLDKILESGDSAGGIIECIVKGMPAGLGEPVFDKLDAELAKAIMSIGATKGIEFGAGFKAESLSGSENNDEFYYDENGCLNKKTNNAGGILGGMSDGSDIVFRVGFKPTPSISKTQNTINKSKENIEISIAGRHDPLIVGRAVVVVEAMSAVALVDALLMNTTSKIDNLRKIYRK